MLQIVKSEGRIPKAEGSPKSEMRMSSLAGFLHLVERRSIRISSFGFRPSDLGFLKADSELAARYRVF